MNNFTIAGTPLPTIPQGTSYFTTSIGINSLPLKTEEDFIDLVSYGSFIHEGTTYISAETKDYSSQVVDQHSYSRINLTKLKPNFYIFSLATLEKLASQNMNNKKIIGYKAPCDMFNGQVKKDDIFSFVQNGIYQHKIYTMILPKEIVETWEPAYEESEKITITIGDSNIEVIITKKGIYVDNTLISDYDLRGLFRPFSAKIGRHYAEAYNVMLIDATYKIGCSYFKLNELKKVIEIWEEMINK